MASPTAIHSQRDRRCAPLSRTPRQPASATSLRNRALGWVQDTREGTSRSRVYSRQHRRICKNECCVSRILRGRECGIPAFQMSTILRTLLPSSCAPSRKPHQLRTLLVSTIRAEIHPRPNDISEPQSRWCIPSYPSHGGTDSPVLYSRSREPLLGITLIQALKATSSVLRCAEFSYTATKGGGSTRPRTTTAYSWVASRPQPQPRRARGGMCVYADYPDVCRPDTSGTSLPDRTIFRTSSG
ncbi:hypothetical protein B0H13DRAFT_106119 [Mycena leptocephala]|nr:hypothetical protein B0H13DRAFT_106119 [Mycena leptocephala]